MPVSVILVDDQASTRVAMGALLQDAGYDVLTVEGADPAIAALAEKHHDVVVTDVFMPGKSGLDLLDEVAARWPDVAVLLITGEPNINTASRAVRAGAYDYLAKPISGDRLASAIVAALERRERRASARALQEAEASLTALVDESPVPMLVSREDVIVRANAELAAMLCTRIVDVIGKPLYSIVHQPDRERMFTHRDRLVETGRATPRAPVRLVRTDGELAYCVGRGIPVRYEGKRGVVVVVSEVSPDLWHSMAEQER